MKPALSARTLICLTGVLLCSCLNFRSVDCATAPAGTGGCPDSGPALARPDGGEADRPVPPKPDNSDPPNTTSDAGDPPATDPGCQSGFHTCAGVCVDSRQPDHCGMACVPCSVITGGTATCDGVKCGVECPAGKKACAAVNACIGIDEPCDGTCPTGKNPCNGLCTLATDKTACGSACAVCPTAANGTTDCDGMQCTLACNTGFHRCGDTCKPDDKVESCGASCTPCTKAEGGSADCVNGSCVATCPAPTVLCKSNGKCLTAGMACDGMCPPGKHECSGNCVPDTDVNSCGTGCTACSAPGNADATCDGKTCGFKCRSGFHQCGDQCKSNNDANACGTSCMNCGANNACQNGECVPTCGTVGQGCCSGSCSVGTCTNGRCCPNGQIWNGNACVTCNCNGSPHCGGDGVITETCNQSTGKCDKHPVASCSGGRRCNGSSCECPPPQTFNGTSCVNPCNCTAGSSCVNGQVVTLTGKCDSSGACEKKTSSCGACQSCQGNGQCKTTCAGSETCQDGVCKPKCGHLAEICCGDDCVQANTYCSFETGNHHCLACGDAGNLACGVGAPPGTSECKGGLYNNGDNFCVSCGNQGGRPPCATCGALGTLACTMGTPCKQGAQLGEYCLKQF
jgi:hypothetical protein